MNLGLIERWASIIGGAALVSYGMKKRSAARTILTILGGDLIYCGATGYSLLYNALGLRPSDQLRGRSASIPYQQGIRVDTAITIDKPREEIYSFWRNLENLPRFMQYVRSVTMIDNKRSHWVAQGLTGITVEWDAEIINDQPNELIGWRSLPGSDMDIAGSVHFKPAPGNRGTEVYIELQYLPLAGMLGAAIAKLMGNDPANQVKDDLRRLKQLLETGEIATTEGQPTGREIVPRREPQRAPRPVPVRGDEVLVASEQSFPASDAPSWTAHKEELVS
jgi:uncharacterized membrane protein